MALDKVGTPYGVHTYFLWSDWLLHARTCNESMITNNKVRLGIDETDPDIIAVRAIRDVRAQGDAIAELLQTRSP